MSTSLLMCLLVGALDIASYEHPLWPDGHILFPQKTQTSGGLWDAVYAWANVTRWLWDMSVEILDLEEKEDSCFEQA